MPVRIIADSSCDISTAQAAAAGITLVPVLVRLAGKEYRDNVDLSTGEFYARLDPAGELPSTAPATTQMFLQAFQSQPSGDEIVCITASGKVSKMFEHATAAAAQSAGNVHVFDSCTVSGGFGLLVAAAARLARTGADGAAILAALQRWRETQYGYAAYPDLKFLAKSGRINKAQMALGLLMHVFPITRVNRSGDMDSEATTKSFEQAKDLLASVISRKMERPAATRVSVTHTNAPDVGEFVAESLRKRLTAPVKELSVSVAGPTIGANVGPGAAGIFMFEE